jgi:hypothetical protein
MRGGGVGKVLSCMLGARDERMTAMIASGRSAESSMTTPTSFGGATFVIDARFATGK